MSIKDALKALAQTILDTEEPIPGDSITEVVEHIADTYEPGEVTVAPGSVTETELAAAVVAKLALADSALQSGDIRLPEGTPTNAKAAAAVMTIDGVAVHGEKVQIGDEVYQFAADAAQTVDEGAIAVDIENNTTKSSGTLTVDTQPSSGDTMTIGTKEFTFVPDGTANADGEISIGTGLETAQDNIEAAINGTDGHNAPCDVICGEFDFGASEAATITARIGGVAGDAIATEEEFTAGTNIFGGMALGSGADCAKADARTALITAIEAGSAIVGAESGDGDTLTITASETGTAGNDIEISTDMVNGAFAEAATKLAGGSNGTVGEKGQTYFDGTYLYVCVAANDVTGTNWRQIALGSAY